MDLPIPWQKEQVEKSAFQLHIYDFIIFCVVSKITLALILHINGYIFGIIRNAVVLGEKYSCKRNSHKAYLFIGRSSIDNIFP